MNELTKILIGNVAAIIGAIFMIMAANAKEKNTTMKLQVVQISIFALSNIVLGSITGAITNVLSIARNILVVKGKYNKVMKWGLCIAITSLSIIFNNIGWLAIFPIISVVLYTLFLDTTEEKLKALIVVTQTLWLIHDIWIHSYVLAFFDIVTIYVSAKFVIQYKILQKQKV